MKDSTKRWPNVLVAGLVAAVVTGVVYTAVSLTSLFTCDAGSGCFLATFFARAPDPVHTGTTLISAAPPPEKPSPSVIAQENPPVLPAGSVSEEAPTFTPAVPTVAAAADAAPAPVEAKKEDAAPIAAVANETSAVATLPDSPAPVASPAIAPATGPTEPEPGVLTDPPAGVVFDENAVPGGPPSGSPPEPPTIVPIIIFQPSGRPLRVH